LSAAFGRPCVERRGPRLAATAAALFFGTGLVSVDRATAALPPGADRVNIYDTPLQVLAGLLAVGFVLTLLVRPLRAHAGSAPAQAQATAKGTA
jgi:hypothetical protein